jgi:hypothetical protein
VAEREGFEPPIPVKVCLISSQVHSTSSAISPRFIIVTANFLEAGGREQRICVCGRRSGRPTLLL